MHFNDYWYEHSLRIALVRIVSKTKQNKTDGQGAQLQSPEWKSWDGSTCWSRVVKGERSALRRKWEDVINGKQRDSVRKGTLVVLTKGPILVKEHNHPLRRPRLREESLLETSVEEERVFQDWKAKEGAKKNLKGTCTEPSCDLWHPPVCTNYKSESRCKYGDRCPFRHTEAGGQPGKKSKKSGGEGSVASLKEKIQFCCVSQYIAFRRKSVPQEIGNLGSNHAVKFSKTTMRRVKIREQKGIMQKCEPQEQHKTNSRNRSDVPAEEHGTWQGMSTNSKKGRKRYVLLSCRSLGNAGILFEKGLKSENS